MTGIQCENTMSVFYISINVLCASEESKWLCGYSVLVINNNVMAMMIFSCNRRSSNNEICLVMKASNQWLFSIQRSWKCNEMCNVMIQ